MKLDVFHMNNFYMLNGEFFTFVNAEAHSNIITEFANDFYHWCKLLFAAKSLRSSMNKTCEVISPSRSILYPVLLVFKS